MTNITSAPYTTITTPTLTAQTQPFFGETGGLSTILSVAYNKLDHFILAQAHRLTKNYHVGTFNVENTKTLAHELIQELSKISEYNLPLARQGLFQLLTLNLEEVQKEILSNLNPLFSLDHLDHDIQNAHEQLIAYEQQLSQILNVCIRSSSYSSQLNLPLLNLYYDLVERLWIVAYLSEDHDCYLSIVEKHALNAKIRAELWIAPLSKDEYLNNSLKERLQKLQKLFNKLLPVKGKSILALRSELCHVVGLKYYSVGKCHEAIKFYEKNLKIAQSLRDLDEEEIAYCCLGAAYHKLGDYPQSIEWHMKDLEIAQKISNFHAESRAYLNLGVVYSSMGDYPKAIECYHKRLETAIPLKDRSEVIQASLSLGDVYYKSGDYLKAIEFYDKFLKVSQIFRDHSGEGKAYCNLGSAYHILGDFNKALEFHTKHLQIAKTLKNIAEEELACFNLGVVHDSLSEHSKAIEFYEKELKIAQALEDRERIKRACLNLGTAYDSLGEPHKAIKFYEQFLNIAQPLQDHNVEAKIYFALGCAHNKISEYSKAVKFYEKCLKTKEALEDRACKRQIYENLSIALDNLLLSNSSLEISVGTDNSEEIDDILEKDVPEKVKKSEKLGKYQGEIEFYEKRLKIAQTQKDVARELQSYNNLGIIYQRSGDYDQVIKFHQKYSSMANSLGSKIFELIANRNLGIVYSQLNQHQEALKFFNNFLKIAIDLKDQANEATAYIDLGIVFFKLDNYQQAIEFQEKALKIVKNQSQEKIVYYQIGNAQRRLGKLKEALESYQKSLEIAQQLKDYKFETIVYIALGNHYNEVGEYHKAIEFYEKRLATASSSGNRRAEGNVYNSMATVYQKLGWYLKAIEFYNKSLDIAKTFHENFSISLIYGNLGNLHSVLGEQLKAIEHYKKSLEIAIIGQSLAGQGRAYINLGAAYHAQGEHKEAMEHYEKSLDIALTIKDRASEGKTYGNIGVLYDELCKPAAAIEFHEKALNIAIEFQDRSTEGHVYGFIGVAYMRMGIMNRAIEFLEKSLFIGIHLKDYEMLARSYNNLGGIYKSLSNINRSKNYFRQSISALSTLYDRLGDQSQWKITYFESVAEPYQNLEDLFITNNNPLETLRITNERRARALVSALNRRLTPSSTPPSANHLTHLEMQQLASKLNTTFILYSLQTFKKDSHDHMSVWVIPPQGEISFQPLAWTPTKTNASPSTQLAEEIQQLVQSIEKLQKEIQTRGYDDLEDELLCLADGANPDEKNQFENAHKQKKKELLAKLGGQDQLASWYNQFIALIKKYLPQDPEQTVTFITDGVLSQLPFGAFYDADKQTYLIEHHPISIVPSLKVLHMLEQLHISSASSEINSNCLIVGNPDTRQTKNRDLKAAEQEADHVSELLRAKSHEVYKKEKAEISQVIQQMPQARWIHLACHGELGHPPDVSDIDFHSVFEGYFKLAPDLPQKSIFTNSPPPAHNNSTMMTLVNSTTKNLQDSASLEAVSAKSIALSQEAHDKGYLLSRQIAELSLKAELVFLSACYSGKGKIQKEGTIGPIWSFLAAGASSVMATYWPLADSPVTVAMVRKFYHEIGGEGKTLNKAQALRHATLEAIQADRDDFTQWGAFFLSGLV